VSRCAAGMDFDKITAAATGSVVGTVTRRPRTWPLAIVVTAQHSDDSGKRFDLALTRQTLVAGTSNVDEPLGQSAVIVKDFSGR
jgi:hypothetical protein